MRYRPYRLLRSKDVNIIINVIFVKQLLKAFIGGRLALHIPGSGHYLHIRLTPIGGLLRLLARHSLLKLMKLLLELLARSDEGLLV